MEDSRSSQNAYPGEFRKTQNWISGTNPQNAKFVPPHVDDLSKGLNDLEAFIYNKSALPKVIRAALLHAQFETLHPFVDGNERTGRMLIPLYLLEKKILDQPILYISDFFEKNRRSYYDALDYARRDRRGVVRWISFFLDGVIFTANEGIKTTENIRKLQEEIFREKIPKLGRRAKNGQKLAEFLFQSPLVDSVKIRNKLNISAQSSQILINEFVNLKILKEITGQKRNRVFVFDNYLQLLRK